MDPLVGGAIVSGISGLLGGAAANSNSRRAQREQQAFQLGMFNKEKAWQEQMWQKVNEYNTPSSQRQRLEDAGINPYMMLGQIDPGVATQASPVQPPVGVAPVGNPEALMAGFGGVSNAIAVASQAMKNVQDIDESKSRTFLHQAKTEESKASSRLKNIEADFNFRTLPLRESILETNLGLAKQQTDLARKQAAYEHERTITQQFENKMNELYGSQLKEADLQHLVAAAEQAAAQAAAAYASGRLSDEQARTEIATRVAKVSNIVAQSAMYSSQANLASQEARTEVWNTALTRVESGIKNSTKRLAFELFDANVDEHKANAMYRQWEADHPWFKTIFGPTTQTLGIGGSILMKDAKGSLRKLKK